MFENNNELFPLDHLSNNIWVIKFFITKNMLHVKIYKNDGLKFFYIIKFKKNKNIYLKKFINLKKINFILFFKIKIIFYVK